MSNTIEPGNNAGMEAPQPKRKRTTPKKAKPAKKEGRDKKAASKPKADRANKKAAVIALRPRKPTKDTRPTKAARIWPAVSAIQRAPSAKGRATSSTPWILNPVARWPTSAPASALCCPI